MLRLKEYCDRVRDDAYGGSTELVKGSLDALKEDMSSHKYGSKSINNRKANAVPTSILCLCFFSSIALLLTHHFHCHRGKNDGY